MEEIIDMAIIGGGAAGFFAAIQAKTLHPAWKVKLFEKSAHLLAKVRISGGGRCNVTHACFDAKELTNYYPRGQKELKGPFSYFQPKDTIAWFANRDVILKTEADGRMFPDSDSSQTIIHALTTAADDAGVQIHTECGLEAATLNPEGNFILTLSTGEKIVAKKLLLSTGGNTHSKGWKIAEALGHTIIPPVPSLFTFNIKDQRLTDLQGLSMPNAVASVPSLKLNTQGPVLITHWGLSGPAILKLSAWGARLLYEKNYDFTLQLNWTGEKAETILQALLSLKKERARQLVDRHLALGFPLRLWETLCHAAGITREDRWADLPKAKIEGLLSQLTDSHFHVTGKSTNKDEFVTAGGIKLAEVNFKTMESKIIPGLYFAGEILDIDGVTGGFNFQAAWTTGWIAGKAQ